LEVNLQENIWKIKIFNWECKINERGLYNNSCRSLQCILRYCKEILVLNLQGNIRKIKILNREWKTNVKRHLQ